MNLPPTEHFPDDPNLMPPARRRRARRLLAPLDADERAAFLAELTHRASPSFDFFLFSLFAGAVISSAFLLDSPPLLVLGAALAPLMAPVIGIALGTVIGSVRFFVRSLVGLVVGCLFVFLAGYLAADLSARYLPAGFLPVTQMSLAHLSTQLLSWPNFLVLAAAAILTTTSIVGSRTATRVPGAALASVALAYELYLPLAAAGLGLGGGEPFLFPDGLVVFGFHLAWAALLGALTLALLGFRPLTLFGYTLGAAVTLVGVILFIGLSSAGAAFGGQIALPTPVPTNTPTITPTLTSTPTPVPPTATLTPTVTPSPTLTPTMTLTPSPTPVLARVHADRGGGALLRDAPGGKIITVLANGTLLKVFPETVEKDRQIWVHVETPEGIQGWVLQTLLVTATPAPAW